MRRHRRMVLIDRIIPFLAALVGLVALAGSVVVQSTMSAQNQALKAELAAARAGMEQLASHHDTLSRRLDALGEPAGGDGTAEALLALQERMVRLEDAAKAAPVAGVPAATDAATAADRPIDPDLPTDDCIPLGTRFMVVPGESFPICQSTVVVTAAAITNEMVALDNGITLVPNTPVPMPGGACTAMLFSADMGGFAEMRVDCR